MNITFKWNNVNHKQLRFVWTIYLPHLSSFPFFLSLPFLSLPPLPLHSLFINIRPPSPNLSSSLLSPLPHSNHDEEPALRPSSAVTTMSTVHSRATSQSLTTSRVWRLRRRSTRSPGSNPPDPLSSSSQPTVSQWPRSCAYFTLQSEATYIAVCTDNEYNTGLHDYRHPHTYWSK